MMQRSMNGSAHLSAPPMMGDLLMPGEVESLKTEIGGIREGMAGFKGEVITELKHIGHDIKNLIQAQAAFMPRTEIKEHLDRRDEARKELGDRVSRIEALIAKVAWAVFLAWIAGLGVAVTAVKALNAAH